MNLLDLMDAPPRYPFTAGFKGAETSRQAAETVNAAGVRAKVLQAIRERGPSTADEAAEHLRIDRLTVRPRCSELKALGKLTDSGTRRPNSSGKNAVVWKLP